MNKEIFKIINNIKSTHLFRVLKKRYPEIFNLIIDTTSFLNRFGKIKFTERVYCILKNLQDRPKCKQCNNIYVSFINYNKGYSSYCSFKCRSIDKEYHKKIKEIKKEKYGDENYNNIEKTKKTKLEKYGNENYCNRKQISYKHYQKTKEDWNRINIKRKQTKLEKYGDENYCNYPKAIETKLNNIDENGLNSYERGSIKNRETCLNKYEVENVFELEVIKNKSKQTKLEKYGDENYCNPDKIKQTKIETIDENGLNSYERGIIKQQKTCLEKYGVSNPIFINNGYSKISQELFWEIYNQLPEELQKKTYFAELNKEFDIFYGYKSQYYYDFVISSIKFCIEFNGDYWHANPMLYESTNILYNNKTAMEIWEYDNKKIEVLKNKGFEVIIVWESEYKENKERVVEEILGGLI